MHYQMPGVRRKVANGVKTLIWACFSHIRGTATRDVDTFTRSQVGCATREAARAQFHQWDSSDKWDQ